MYKVSLNYKRRKNRGQSQFIREKLEEEYNPKFRITGLFKSAYQSKTKAEVISKTQKQHISQLTITSIKEGKKISMDWNQHHSLKIDEHRSHHHRQISRGNDIFGKNKKLIQLLKRANQPKTSLKTKTQVEEIQRPRKTTLMGWSPQKYTSFIEHNKQKLKRALYFENQLSKEEEEIEGHNEKQKRQMRLTQIKEKLFHRSKLTLLKSRIIQRFNQSMQNNKNDNRIQ